MLHWTGSSRPALSAGLWFIFSMSTRTTKHRSVGEPEAGTGSCRRRGFPTPCARNGLRPPRQREASRWGESHDALDCSPHTARVRDAVAHWKTAVDRGSRSLGTEASGEGAAPRPRYHLGASLESGGHHCRRDKAQQETEFREETHQ